MVGPPLTALPSKISDPRWLMAWVLKPSRLRPRTLMPDFDPSLEEAQAMVAYLYGHEPARQGTVKWEGGDAAAGEKLFVSRGCRGCHSVSAEEPSVSPRVPNLAGVGLKARGDWLFNWIKSPRAYNPHTPMPQLALSDDDIRHLVAYLLSCRAGSELIAAAPAPDPKVSAAAGRAVIERYECPSCHAVSGFPPPAPVEVHASASDTQATLAAGRLLVTYYNCRGCHRIEGKGGAIGAYLERKTLAPPTLDGEGARVQPSWLTAFLRQPATLRPWLQIRMPNFGLSDSEVTLLTHYFAAVSSVPTTDEAAEPVADEVMQRGLRRIAHFKCAQCHPLGTHLPADIDAENLSINLMQAKSRLRPSWIRKFLAQPKSLVGTQTRMPDIFYTIDGIPKVEHPDTDIDAIAAYLLHTTQPLDAALAALDEDRKAAEEKQQVDWSSVQY